MLDAWAEGDEDIVCVVPEGVAQSELDRWTGGAVPHPGAPAVRGRLTLAVAHFVDQDAFDRRLWACDLNFVRGEDSLVRALWAAQPLVWHIYPQAEDVHLLKLDALLTRFEAGLTRTSWSLPQSRPAHFWRAWNVGDPGARPPPRGPRSAPPCRHSRLAAALRGNRAGPTDGPRRGAGHVLRKSFIIKGFPDSHLNSRWPRMPRAAASRRSNTQESL